MKRLKKIVFDGLTAISVILFVATAALWLRSFRRVDIVQSVSTTPNSLRWVEITSEKNSLTFGIWRLGKTGIGQSFAEVPKGLHLSSRGTGDFLEPTFAEQFTLATDFSRNGYHRLGFHFTRVISEMSELLGERDSRALLVIPFWPLFLIFAAIPTWRLCWRKLDVRVRLNHCGRCGYDLRGTQRQ